jgi:hypothetical protein
VSIDSIVSQNRRQDVALTAIHKLILWINKLKKDGWIAGDHDQEKSKKVLP